MDLRAVAVKHGRRVVQIRGTIDEDCCICFSTMRGRSIAIQPCGHATHLKCERLLRTSKCKTRSRCPICRTVVVDDSSAFDECVPMPSDIDSLDFLASVLSYLEASVVDEEDIFLERLLREQSGADRPPSPLP